jgi:hypothetical protein
MSFIVLRQDPHWRHVTCSATWDTTWNTARLIWEWCVLNWELRPERFSSKMTGTLVQLVCNMWCNMVYHVSVHASCNVAAVMASDNEETSVKLVQTVKNFVYLYDYLHEYYANKDTLSVIGGCRTTQCSILHLFLVNSALLHFLFLLT